MRNPWLVRNRTSLAIVAVMIAGLVVSAGSGSRAAVYARQASSSRPATASCGGSTVYCFEKVDYKTNGDCNYLTGINDYQAIVGAYNNCAGGDYQSFAATSPQATGKPTGLPSYPPGDFVAEGYPGSNGDYNFFVQGNDNGLGFSGGEPTLQNMIMVGSWQPGGSLCSGLTCGAWLKNTAWTSIHDPSQGTGPCAVTELMAVNDSHLAVGYYDKNIPGTDLCTQQAFEYYIDGNDSSGNDEYHDLSPTAPSGTFVSSEATSINQLGDVSGTVTWTSGSNQYVSGWVYIDRAYYNMICSSSCPTTSDTYALGVNYNDDVVGYYVSGSHDVGFITYNPKSNSPSFTTIDDNDNNSNYTIVRAINSNCLIAGTTKDNQGVLHGFVGFPRAQCTGGSSDRRAHAKSSPKSHKP